VTGDHQGVGAPHTGLPGSHGEHVLQRLFDTGERAERFYGKQVLDHLNAQMRAFIARQEMAFVATADAGGECDSSLRTGPPGFIRTLDEHTLAYPEYRGNGVLASLGNILENAHIGILMVDFFRDLVGLHVNGHAEILTKTEMAARAPHTALPESAGGRTERWVTVRVEEAYIHCSKHIPLLVMGDRQRQVAERKVKPAGPEYFTGTRSESLVAGCETAGCETGPQAPRRNRRAELR
jgi:uncharacterized protein